MSEKLIYTIGTSSHFIDEFIKILKKYNIKTAIDVRSFPKSKIYPQFNQDNLATVLEKNEINYVYLGKELGGFRKGGYENYMKKEDFKRGIEILEDVAKSGLSVFFCAEKLFFRCHRKFISEALCERDWRVLHIVEIDKLYEHTKLESGQIVLDFE